MTWAEMVAGGSDLLCYAQGKGHARPVEHGMMVGATNLQGCSLDLLSGSCSREAAEKWEPLPTRDFRLRLGFCQVGFFQQAVDGRHRQSNLGENAGV